jgi:hypothetical protein
VERRGGGTGREDRYRRGDGGTGRGEMEKGSTGGEGKGERGMQRGEVEKEEFDAI